VAWIVDVLFTYTAAASALDVNLVFAAFLAGYALATEPELIDATTTLNKVSFAIFIPLYLAIIGLQLDLTKTFPPRLVVTVLILACSVKLVSAGLAARLAGFRWRDSIDLSIALNARGGPGIVVATVAYDAAIINAEFFTALLVLAIATSQAAGAWLDYLIRSGSSLLGEPTTAVIADATARASPQPPGSVSAS
jgi:Kef-type K+ transport system membrane component KefB